MPFNRENFPYAEYAAEVEGVDWAEVESQTEDLERSRNALYEKALKDFIAEQDKKTGVDNYAATLEAEKHFVDAREVLGIPQAREKDEQLNLIKPDAFRKYLLSKDLGETEKNWPIDTYIDGYIDSVHGDKFANPYLSQLKKSKLKDRFMDGIGKSVADIKIDDSEYEDPYELEPQDYKVKDFLSATVIKEESPVESANDADKEAKGEKQTDVNPVYRAGQAFGEMLSGLGPNFKRSWVNEDTQDAADRIANPVTTQLVDRIGSEVPDVIYVDPRPQIERAAADWVDSRKRRADIGEDPVLQKLFESEDIGAAVKNLFSDASVFPKILAENGVDILEEAGTQIVATGVGSLATPLVGIGAGSTAAATVAKQNAYNAFFDQQIERYLQDKKLPMTKESVMQFYDDKEAYSEAKEKAQTSSDIIASGAFASSAVGGYLAIGTAAKIAARAGLEPALEGGEVVFKQVTRGDVAARLGTAALASTVIDTTSDIGSKIVVDEEVTPADLVVTPFTSAVMSIPDVGGGLIAGGGDVIGPRREIRAGDILFNEDGQAITVTGGDGRSITASDGTTSETIVPQQIGSQYVSQSEVADTANRRIALTSERTELEIEHYNGGGDVLDEAVNAIQNRDSDTPELPDNMVSTLDEELSTAEGDAPFTDVLNRAGDAIIWTEDNNLIFDDAQRVLADGLKPLTYQDERGVYRPIITSQMNEEQVQARAWAAEIINYLGKRAGADNIKRKALSATRPDARPAPEEDPQALLRRSNELGAEEDRLESEIESATQANDFVTAQSLDDELKSIQAQKRKVDADYMRSSDVILLPRDVTEQSGSLSQRIIAPDNSESFDDAYRRIYGQNNESETPETGITSKLATDKSGRLKEDLSDPNLFGAISMLVNELDTTGTSLSPVEGSGFQSGEGRSGTQFKRNPSNNPDWFKWTEDAQGKSRPTFRGIKPDGSYTSETTSYSAQELIDAVAVIREGKNPTKRQENILRGLIDVAREQIKEVNRQTQDELDAIFGTIDVDDAPDSSVALMTQRLKENLSEDDFEFFLTRNGALPDDQFIARANAVLEDPTIRADFSKIRADLQSPVQQPIPEAPAQPEAPALINTKFVEVAPEREYNYGDQASNYIPQSIINEIIADGYEVETIGEEGAISGLRVKVGEKQDSKGKTVPVYASISSRGPSNPKEIKDRSFSVRMPGRKLRKYGGNKKFTIPSELQPIIASERPAEFVQSVNDAAAAAGYRVKSSSDNSVRTITRGNESYEIRNENGQIYIDGEPMGTHVGIRQTPVTREQAIKEKVAKTKTEARAEYALRNPRPEPISFNQKTNEKIENRLADLDESVPTTPINNNYSVADTGGPVRLEIGGDPDVTMRHAKMDTAKSVTNVLGQGKKDYTDADIQAYIDRLPPHIAEMITLHGTFDNPARNLGALGFFHPDYNGNGPQIHIDTYQDGKRTLEGIISTISEEVAHFSFENWTTGQSLRHMKNFYDKAFRYYRAQIEGSLPVYIESYDVDMNNPTPWQQYVLVNELFSKQGTSFIDLLDKKAMRPDGLTDAEFSELRRIGREAQDAFYFDMTDGGKNNDMRSFAEEILKAQAASVVGKQTVFDMKIDRNGRTLRIIPTPIGQNRTVLPVSKEGEKLRNRLNKSSKWYWRWMYKNAPHGNMLSTREIDRVIANASGLDHAKNRKVLQRHYYVARRVEAILKSKGYTEVNQEVMKNGVRNLFESLGIKNKSALSVADEADEFVNTGADAIIHNAENIRIEIDRQVALLRAWGEREGIDPVQLGVMLDELRQTASKYRSDWMHRRYRAFEDPAEKKVFQEMLDELNGVKNPDGSLYEQKLAAEAEIRKIKASKFGKVAKEIAIAEQERIARKYDRLQHLYKKFHFESNRDKGSIDNTQYVKEVKAYLRKLISDNKAYQGGTFTKLENISANRGRKLDQDAGENTSDYHEIKFLEPIENPVENIVFSLYQQKEILRSLQANHTLAKELVEGIGGDIAYVKGSPDITDEGSEFLGIGQGGSILKYLQIDPVLQQNLEEQINIQSDINQHMFERMAHDAIGSIKFGQTVLNPGTAAANYLGAASVAFANGHMLYFNKLARQPKAYREAWIQRKQEKNSVTNESYHELIIREMNEMRVLGTGIQAGTLEITTRGTFYQKFLQGITTIIGKAGAEDAAIRGRSAIDDTFDWIQDAYTFSDDMPKIIGYMIERDKAELKWKAKLNRADYETQDAYNQALESAIKREAADKTLRQNTDWGVSPQFAKHMAHNNNRYFVGDYIMHTMQMAKITIEQGRLFREELADLKEAQAGGHKEWEAALLRSITARAIGNGGIITGLGAAGIYGYSLFPLMMNALIEPIAEAVKGLDSDEDDNIMDSDQRLGMSQLMMFSTWGGAVKYEPLAVKDGDYIYALNSARLNNFGVFNALPSPSTEYEAMDQIGNLLSNMLLGGSSGTNATQILDAARGIDWKGDQLEGWEKWENRIKVLVDKTAPGVLKEAYEVVYGESWLTGKYQGRDETLMANLGLSMKKVYVPEIATNLGYEIGRKYRKRGSISALVKAIERGNLTVSQADIVSRIRSDFEANQKLMRRYNFFTQAWVRAGYTKKEAIHHMAQSYTRAKGTGLSGKNAGKLVNGVDIFTHNSMKKLTDLRDNLKERPVTKAWPKEWKDRAIENAEFAIDQYRIILNKKD